MGDIFAYCILVFAGISMLQSIGGSVSSNHSNQRSRHRKDDYY